MTTNLNIQVGEIMSAKLVTLHPKDKLQSAKDLFEQYDIHHIPVEVMGEVKGIISLGDLLFLQGVVENSFDQFIQTKKLQLATVDEIMTPRPYCIDKDALINEAMDIMIEKRINCLPVKKDDTLVGIITNFDLIKYFNSKIS